MKTLELESDCAGTIVVNFELGTATFIESPAQDFVLINTRPTDDYYHFQYQDDEFRLLVEGETATLEVRSWRVTGAYSKD
jgi:hypothetical protein